MKSLLFAAIADDDTGASDLAGMLADQGVRAVLVLDPALLDESHPQLAAAQAIVLATASRALPRQRAYDITADAVRRVSTLGARTIQVKYCSTFDSTSEGNIGPSLDAALDTLGEAFTVAVPALPVNGRTTYCGYHFVKGQLLSDSPMRHHPLTPMTNANLVDHLQRQTSRPVGLTPSSVVAAGPDAISRQWTELRQAGINISVVDCVDDADSAAIAEAACELPLISGSSLFGTHLPAAWRRRGWCPAPSPRLWDEVVLSAGRGRLVVAGSCSTATAAQNAWLARNGAELVELETQSLLETDIAHRILVNVVEFLAAEKSVLLKTRSTPDAILKTQQWAASRAWTPADLGLKIATAVASLTRSIVALQTPEVLVCAGGETSSAICRALGIRGFAVGRNIQAGVPLCFPLASVALPMVLKSGNFGTEDFYAAAFAASSRVRSATY